MPRLALISLAAALLLPACGGASPCHPAVATGLACATAPCAPGPPARGPGSLEAPHGDVVVEHTKRGVLGGDSFTTYEPASPAPARAPVVLFLHGYFDAEPTGIDTMLRHLARKGFIVVYPTYGMPWGPGGWEDHAIDAFRVALESLDGAGHVHPDRARVAYVGHSIGGLLALRLAQRAGATKDPRLPAPSAVVLLDGAGLSTPAYPFLPIEDLSAVPASVWLLSVMTEESYLARRKEPGECRADETSRPAGCNAFGIARKAFAGTPQIPREKKAAVVIPSDARGNARLRSDHNAVIDHCGATPRPIDAIDTWGHWKLTVGALLQATRGTSGEYAFGDTKQVHDMGTWSDGHPVRPIFSIDACLLGGECP